MSKLPTMYAEIADTPQLRELGLMFRERLASNSGMIFVFPHDMRLSFWMKDTPLPLDIAFIDEDFIIRQVESMTPYSTRGVRSSFPCKYALEVNSGFFDQHGVSIGSSLRFAQLLDDEENEEDEEVVTEEPEIDEIPEEPEIEVAPPPSPKPDLVINMSFREAIDLANNMKLSVAFDYEYPEGNINSYVLFPLDRYEVKSGRTNGPLVGGPCVHSGGEYRNFIIDNIINFDLYETEGENAGRLVQTPSPAAFVPPPVDSYQLAASTNPKVDLFKSAQSYSTGQLMMTEYWDDLKKKKEEGKTEGQAILDYLQENSAKNSPKKKKKKRKRK